MEYVVRRTPSEDELYHYGVKGMKWGVRRGSNSPATGLRATLAKRSNDKVDKSFKDWKENAAKRDNAIELGKKANISKLAYEKNKSDKGLKAEYKKDNKAYKRALNENTTYRKGVVRQEVKQDIARKYLSEAKKVKKQLDKDPSNKQLQKEYKNFIAKHDIERASARRAVSVSSKRSKMKATMKRSMTMTVKAAATAAVISAGVYAANRYMSNHKVTLDGKDVRFSTQKVVNVINVAKKVKDFMGYLY